MNLAESGEYGAAGEGSRLDVDRVRRRIGKVANVGGVDILGFQRFLDEPVRKTGGVPLAGQRAGGPPNADLRVLANRRT